MNDWNVSALCYHYHITGWKQPRCKYLQEKLLGRTCQVSTANVVLYKNPACQGNNNNMHVFLSARAY